MAKKVAVLIVALFLLLTPLSVAAQYSSVDSQYKPPKQSYSEVSFADDTGAPTKAEGITNQNFSAQGCSGQYPNYCGGNCWTNCGSGYVFSCDNGNGYCCPPDKKYHWNGKCNKCPSNYPNDCGSSCWSNCGSGYVFSCNNGNGYCCSPDKPYYWGGSCHKCSSDYPNECGGGCWKCSSSSDSFTCYNGNAKCCSSSYPYYCGRTDGCWKDSNQCNNAIWCNGQWSACTTSTYKPNCVNNNVYCCPSDTPYYRNGQCTKCPADKPIECGGGCYSSSDCNGQWSCVNNEFKCCPSDNSYYCPRTGNCWLNQERCDTAIYCGGSWWACNDPDDNEKCVDGKGGCCPSGYSYYCPSKNVCFKENGLCDGRPVHNCNGKRWVCLSKDDKGTCYGDELRCCPSSYPYWWETDKQCHASPYQQKTCSFPDGSSSECDCNSNSQCPPSKQYCEENYPSPISDGYDACLASEPEYCGNGKCAGNEDYNNCPNDCSAYAPKGTVNVDVSYSSGSNANKPISGAYVYLDGALKGTAGSDGKKSFEVAYGQHTVKVNCPDNAFCESKTVDVEGAEYVGFSCKCNPPGDSDGDGDSDEDERLLGTDPNDAAENYASVFSGFEYPKSCLDVPAMLKLVWDNRGDLVQSHQEVLFALNTTEVTSVNLEEKPSVLLQALGKAELGARIEVAPQNSTLREVFGTAEYVDGFFTEHGAVIILTDNETSSTAIIAISAVCVGNFVGLLYGAGTGVKDDVVGIGSLLKGIWYMLATDTSKLASDVTDFIIAIPQLLQAKDKIFHDMLIGILGNGRDVTEKTGLFKSDRDEYLRFQIGFVTGFVSGYVAEQIVSLVIGPKTIIAKLKGGQLLWRPGKTVKLPALLVEKLTGEFGQEASTILAKLKYAGRIAEWSEAEQKGIARIAKLNGDNWLKKLGEGEAKLAAGPINTLSLKGVPDSSLQRLLETDIGRKTLLATDLNYDLLSKQAKLAEKWGAKKLDEVVSKCILLVCYGNRVDDFNKLLEELPSGVVANLNRANAIGILGDSAFDNILKALRELKDVKGYNEVVDTLAKQSTWTGPANQLKQALKLKESGKIVTEFEKPFYKPNGELAGKIDVVFKEKGSTTEIFMETKNTISVSNIDDLKEQLRNYYDYAANKDWGKIRLTSGSPIPKKAIDELRKEFGKDAVDKILSG